MTKMHITGLAQETDFANPEKTRSVLIIDGGRLRLTIKDEEIVELLKYAVEADQDIQEERPTQEPAAEEDREENAGPYPAPLSVVSGGDDEEEDAILDESGISQI